VNDRSWGRPAGRRQVAADAGLGIVFTVVLAAAAYRLAAAGHDWVLDCVAGMVVCGAALVRERDRARAAAVGLAAAATAEAAATAAHLPGQPGVAATLGLLVLGGSAVRTLPPLRAAGITAAGVAVTAAGFWLNTHHVYVTPAPVKSGMLGWIPAVAVGLVFRFADHSRRAAAEAIRREERLTLARELHDVVAHHITGIVLQAQAARMITRNSPRELDQTLDEIETAGTEAMTAMRRVVTLLRDPDEAATTSPGPGEIADLVRRFDGYGPPVRLHLAADQQAWPPEMAATVCRVIQESLTNIARHAARARSADISVTQDQKQITVQITDDAPPGPSRFPHRGGHGLAGMRERVMALGGTLHAGPQPGAGWQVRATLPAPAGNNAGARR
jgi:signal transduction histidine kinase